LVRSVQHIASSSVEQARINNQLLDRARQIQASTEQTGREMSEQTKSTDILVDYSNNLVSIVSVFKLPGEETVDIELNETTHINLDSLPPPAELKRAI
ncbi:MAG: hypothetical protein WBN96_06580, partial [Gammaproteobacteria bacterium]